MVADDLITLALNESLNPFESMLQWARAIDRKSRANQQEQNQQKCENQKLHGKRIWYRCRRVSGFDMQYAQQRRNRAREKAVQKCGEPKLFMHKILAQLFRDPKDPRVKHHEPARRTVREALRSRLPPRAKISPQ